MPCTFSHPNVTHMVAALLLAVAPYLRSATPDELARRILDTSGVTGGFVVHVGCGTGELTGALHASDSFLVQGFDTNASSVQAGRKALHTAGLYGTVAIDRFDGNVLPLVDGFANLIVVGNNDSTGSVSNDELLRVLCPNGVAVFLDAAGNIQASRELRKPHPDNTDEWTHGLYDAGNNAVSHDLAVAPPRHLQWVGGPRWTRHHDRMSSFSVLVSSGGRVFYIMDEGSRACVQLTPKWKLIARDAYNGTILWKRDVPKWHFHLWPLKSGPAQLTRTLVCHANEVYATLSLRGPVSQLDAATGKTKQVYAQTEGTEELLYDDGVLFLMVNPDPIKEEPFQPDNTGTWNDTRRVGGTITWDRKMDRAVVAVNAKDGRTLWRVDAPVAPLTLTAYRNRVYYFDGESVVALNRKDGTQVWRSDKLGRRKRFSANYGPNLLAYEDVVLFAGGNRSSYGLAAADGKVLWQGKQYASGHSSPQDLFVIDDLAWICAVGQGNGPGTFTAYDLHTGEVKREFTPDVDTYWFHHRCHRGRATDRFIMPSRTGIEFVDLKTQHWDANHWIRGACVYGIMPANGLLYAPQHSCACYLESKLYGFNAVTAKRAPRPNADTTAARLEKGLAYGRMKDEGGRMNRAEQKNDAGGIHPSSLSLHPSRDWSTYRHDAKRSGATPARISSDLRKAWCTQLKGRLTSPVIAAGNVYVAEIDAHTLHALRGDTGTPTWSFTAGGRIDSPPTVHQGHALFGSADGYVYCLRATDGALAWRFRAAPEDLRLSAFEQIESVWPVHGSVLVQDGIAYCTAGRSMFIDGGMRLYRLRVSTGELISETILDEKDPTTGGNLTDKVKVLNMPTALPDVLSCDGKNVYMRSQRFTLDGKREEATPLPTDPVALSSSQAGDDRHLFSPAGFLDGSWFHRSYWLYGRRYSSGCNWWSRAGKFTPAGRILSFNDDNVYGYGRKPSYFRWSVPLDYHLFGCERDPAILSAGRAPESTIKVKRSATLNPANKPLTVAAWIKASDDTGIVLARGGASLGYALALADGKPQAMLRAGGRLTTVTGKESIKERWAHVAMGLTAEKELNLFVDGQLAGTVKAPALITKDPNDAMDLGTDTGSPVGDYKQAPSFKGLLDDVRIYNHTLSNAQLAELAAGSALPDPKPVLHFSFDKGDARDDSGNENHGALGTKAVKGKLGNAMRFTGATDQKSDHLRRGSLTFSLNWSEDVPIHGRAMVLTPDVLFVAGPPDVIDEEATYQAPHTPETKRQWDEQDAAFSGKRGGTLLAFSVENGAKLAEHKLASPPTWDGMAGVDTLLVLTALDGTVTAFGPQAKANE